MSSFSIKNADGSVYDSVMMLLLMAQINTVDYTRITRDSNYSVLL